MQVLQSMTATRSPPVIAVVSRKGGVGKSTCTALMSRIFAENELRVVVLDLDPQGTASAALLPEEHHNDDQVEELGRRLRAGDSIAELVVESAFEGLFVIPTSEHLTFHAGALDADNLGVMKMARSVSSLADTKADIVLVDTPGDYGVMTFGALVGSGWALVPTLCQEASVRELPKALAAIREASGLNERLKLAGIIANGLDRRTRHELSTLETLRECFPTELIDPPIPKATALTDAMRPDSTLDEDNAGVLAMASVAESLLGRIANASLEQAA